VQLLRITSSIEYPMMVKYLYGGYSLGGENVLQSDNLTKVNVWRKLILSIAKEEMRQNVRCPLGGQMESVRDNYPWHGKFDPFELPRPRRFLVCARRQ
jgi:Ferritin-like